LYKKINSKWIKDLDVNTKATRREIEETLEDISIGHDFLNKNSNSSGSRNKKWRMRLHQIKKLLHIR
jgi:hypothetical protein